jgi:magnesium chelatase subunit D
MEQDDPAGQDAAPEQVAAIGQTAAVTLPRPDKRRRKAEISHARYGRSTAPRGRPVGVRETWEASSDLALAATVRAAAPHQPARRVRSGPGVAVRIERADLRAATRRARPRALILFVIDASGSMGARERMAAAKGAVLALLVDAYQRRERVGLIACRGATAAVLLPPTASVAHAERCLADLPTGGRTPLAHALVTARDLVARARRTEPSLQPLLVVVSDGRANVALAGGDALADAHAVADELAAAGVACLVVDAEDGTPRLGLAAVLADHLAAPRHHLADLTAAALEATVRAALPREAGDGR